MIDLNEVLEEWTKDNVIIDIHLDESSRKTPLLHSKYLEKLANASRRQHGPAPTAPAHRNAC